MITIIDYGMGNLRSVQKAFSRLNIETQITNDNLKIKKASKIVLPGVGHFKKGMENIKSLGIAEILNIKVLEEKCPILGICLGMQLMTRYSEEGGIEGLGWIDASTKKFTLTKLKVPHMGWNTLEVSKNSTILKLGNNNHYYFVHSYYVKCENEKDILTSTNYGINFDSSFQKENITGVQFHPEKSHKTGLELLENFSKS